MNSFAKEQWKYLIETDRKLHRVNIRNIFKLVVLPITKSVDDNFSFSVIFLVTAY